MASCIATGVREPRAAPRNSTIDEYEEICCLGMGAFGAVYKKVRHRATGQIVAIKRLTDAVGFVAQIPLLREAGLLKKSCRDNPFVVGLLSIARNPATMDSFLVMECVGPSLCDLLRQRHHAGMPPLPEATVRAVMWQLLTGAKKMHDGHVVHRDIKPGNILVSADGTIVKICDFGLAMGMDVQEPPYEATGTLWYMAPEMLLGKPDYDARVDTWSLGCVMAELIKGSRLFAHSDAANQLAGIFEVLGVPDETAWPWFSSTPFATQIVPIQGRNLLREFFPETKLSEEGFQRQWTTGAGSAWCGTCSAGDLAQRWKGEGRKAPQCVTNRADGGRREEDDDQSKNRETEEEENGSPRENDRG